MAKEIILTGCDNDGRLTAYLNAKCKCFIAIGDLEKDAFGYGNIVLDYEDLCDFIKELQKIKKQMQ